METLTWNFNENWFSVAVSLLDQVSLLLKITEKSGNNKISSAFNNRISAVVEMFNTLLHWKLS